MVSHRIVVLGALATLWANAAFAGIASVAGLEVAPRTPPSKWAFIVSVDDSPTRDPNQASTSSYGRRIENLLRSAYGYPDSQITHIFGESVTRSQVNRALISITGKLKSNDSLAVFLLSDLYVDPSTGARLITSEGLRNRDFLLQVSAIAETITRSPAREIFMFLQSCPEYSGTARDVFRAPKTSITRGVQLSKKTTSSLSRVKQVSILYGCEWAPSREQQAFRRAFVDALEENTESTLAVSQIAARLDHELGSHKVTFQYPRTIGSFRFILSTNTLDAEAVRVMQSIGESYSSRSAAIRQLADSAMAKFREGNKALIDKLGKELVKLVADTDADNRIGSFAVSQIATLPTEHSQARLVQILKMVDDVDVLLRADALWELGALQTTTSDQLVLENISSPEAAIRDTALEVVEKIILSDAIDPILDQLAIEPDEELTYLALDALEVLASDTEFSDSQVDALNKIALNNEGTTDFRREVLAVIGAVGNARSLPAVEKIVHTATGDSRLRERAIYTLGRLRLNAQQKDIVAHDLFKAVDDPSSQVRVAAIYVLGGLEAISAIAKLNDIIVGAGFDDDAKIAAAEAVGNIGAESSIPALASALESGGFELRLTSVVALRQIGTDKAAQALLIAYADESEFIRSDAIDAFREIDPKNIDVPDDLVDKIRGARDPKVRAVYVERLGLVDDENTVQVLIEFLGDESNLVATTAIDALVVSSQQKFILDALSDVAASGDKVDQLRATQVLAEIDSPQSISILQSMVDAGNQVVRAAAVRALGNHADTESIETLWRLVESDYDLTITSLDALSNIGSTYYSSGDFELGIAITQRVVQHREKLFGREDPVIATEYNNLAAMYQKSGNLDVAEDLFLRAVALQSQSGNRGAAPATSYSNLGHLYIVRGDSLQAQGGTAPETNAYYEKAESAFFAALNIRESALGPYSISVADTFDSLALVNTKMGYEDGAQNFEDKANQIRTFNDRDEGEKLYIR